MIVVGGENLIDYVQTGFEAELPVYTAMPGGSCYNVAIAIGRQNQPVKYVTPISIDSLGKILANRLIADGVILGAPRNEAPTSLAVVSIFDGQPHYQFYRNQTAERKVTMYLLNRAIEKKTATIFHIGSLSLIDGDDASFWESKFQSLASEGVITSLDPNVRPIAINNKTSYIARINRMMKVACILKLSDEDLTYLMPDMVLEDAFTKLCSKTNAKLVILTRGSEGAFVRTPSQTFSVNGVTAVPLRDTVGAGDTFMGTILVELHKRKLSVENITKLSFEDLRTMVERAAMAATLTCQKVGCNPPYEKDLLTYIN